MQSPGLAGRGNMESCSSTQSRYKQKQPGWSQLLPHAVSKGIPRFCGVLASLTILSSARTVWWRWKKPELIPAKAQEKTTGQLRTSYQSKLCIKANTSPATKDSPRKSSATLGPGLGTLLGVPGGGTQWLQCQGQQIDTALPPKAFPQMKSYQQAPEGGQLPTLPAGTQTNHGCKCPLWVGSGKNCLARAWESP